MDNSQHVFDPVPWPANGKPCVVSIGNVCDGFRFYGIFPNAEEAMKWASEQAGTSEREQDSWDVIELLAP
jgi:hypothetical protein